MNEDIIAKGIAGGWQLIDAAIMDKDLTLEADVVVIGSGAGAARRLKFSAMQG